ncbi:hypothetical protein E2C01_014915 [Portunus trituberculatus]|uniref:Uncharacterized protein n=1 Tax=Portunus trituberculatus TaxID=210409 RepID=A0A5B7DJZ2_PORTR|nr:hypothetical protein [Portunus trituberculatus]
MAGGLCEVGDYTMNNAASQQLAALSRSMHSWVTFDFTVGAASAPVWAAQFVDSGDGFWNR